MHGISVSKRLLPHSMQPCFREVLTVPDTLFSPVFRKPQLPLPQCLEIYIHWHFSKSIGWAQDHQLELSQGLGTSNSTHACRTVHKTHAWMVRIIHCFMHITQLRCVTLTQPFSKHGSIMSFSTPSGPWLQPWTAFENFKPDAQTHGGAHAWYVMHAFMHVLYKS